MKKNISITDVFKLSVSERIQVVEDIWDSISRNPDAVTLTTDQKEELDSRLGGYRQNPAAGSAWSQIKKKIAKR